MLRTRTLLIQKRKTCNSFFEISVYKFRWQQSYYKRTRTHTHTHIHIYIYIWDLVGIHSNGLLECATIHFRRLVLTFHRKTPSELKHGNSMFTQHVGTLSAKLHSIICQKTIISCTNKLRYTKLHFYFQLRSYH